MSHERLIVVIDDDESFCLALVGLLRSLGYEAHGFVSAEAFLGSDAIGRCDCVISDIHLPGMSGIDLKALLATRDRPMPVIMVTARKDPDLQARALKSGAVCLLTKPLQTTTLIECLNKALDT